MYEVYKNIRERRKELKMSQLELAQMTGYTNRSTIAKIETGAIDISLPKVVVFAKALNTTVEALMGYENIDELNEIYKASADEYAAELTITEHLRSVLESDPECAKHQWTDQELNEVLEYARFKARG